MKTSNRKKLAKDIEEIKEAILKVKSYEGIPESQKNKMLEDFEKALKELQTKEIAIFTDEVFYGKAPTKFLRNPEIKLQAKGLYTIMHTYSQPKDLMLNPKTFVSLETLSRDADFFILTLLSQGFLERAKAKSEKYIMRMENKPLEVFRRCWI